MTNQTLIPTDIAARYEVHEWRNGLAILSAAHPGEWRDILEVLRGFALLRSDVMKPGGSKGLISSKLDSHFTRLGWIEKKFDTKIVVDNERAHCADAQGGLLQESGGARSRMEQQGSVLRSRSEQLPPAVRTARHRRRRHHHAVHGIAENLQPLGRGPSFGNSTTHMAKLRPRLDGGSGGGCPVVVFGISEACYVED